MVAHGSLRPHPRASLLGPAVLLGRGGFGAVASYGLGRFHARREDSQHCKPMASPLGITSLGYVIVFVRDMDRAVAFYRDTLGLPAQAVSPHWSEFSLGGTTLALHGVEDGWPPAPARAADPAKKKGVPIELVFSVPDPLRAHAQLATRGVVMAEPRMVHEAGDQVGVSCLFEDPDGNLLSVYGLVGKADWAKRG